jgi:uncharacterized Zn-binding protein involved in type VI secretion
MSGGLTYAQMLGLKSKVIEKTFDNFDFGLRVAMPGIIQSFDSTKQTVEVVVAITEIVLQEDGSYATEEIPILVDVPICFPTAGGFSVTFPVVKGDECLVVFADTCFDAWHFKGAQETGEDIAQDQMSLRRHDLSDGIAILGLNSQITKLTNYSEDSLQIRSDEEQTYIDVKDDAIKIVVNETYLEVKDGEINIDSQTTINIKNTGDIAIEGGTVEIKGDSVVIASGTMGVARIGDAVSVNPSTHIGTITAGSTKVKAG